MRNVRRRGYRLETVVEITGLDKVAIVRTIEQGYVDVEQAGEDTWLFLDEDLARLRRLRRLMLDFDIGLDAAGLILELRRRAEEEQGRSG